MAKQEAKQKEGRQQEIGEKPIKNFRAGGVKAAVWENVIEGKDASFKAYSVTVTRGYKDKNDEWQDTTSLKPNDLPKARLVLAKAYEFIVTRQDEE